MKWRIVGTDAEQDSGVAPRCGQPTEHEQWARKSGSEYVLVDGPDVYDCCAVGPHFECGSIDAAIKVQFALNNANFGEGAEFCE